MGNPLTQKLKFPFNKLIIRLVTLTVFILFSINTAKSQAPAWVAGTPSVVSVGAMSVTVNFGINMTGTIYIMVMNYNAGPYSSATVKASALLPPSGSIGAVIPVAAGNINTILQATIYVSQANTLHSVFLVAESSGGVLQAVPVKLLATTLPCPMINILTSFTQPVICINQNPVATFEVVILNPDPNINGILKGTTWTLDWGDGNTSNYTSIADNDLPPVALRTHTYSTITSGNYVFSNSVKNPCGQTRAVQYIGVVHGRDIPSDGDGALRLVDNASGSAIIEVCEGKQSIITLRDNSTWNCQNPILPGGITAIPNIEPRNIEWLYGRDPLGSLTNTITGTVAVAVLGNAPQASGRFSPTPYGPSSLSQSITIPATCVAGQFFRVYLKNWNKCNWDDPDYIYTSIDIKVVAPPPAPTIPSRSICFGAGRTLTVTSVPVGTISWYSDEALTTLLGTGITFTPEQTAVGSYNFWVVDRSATVQLCQGPSTLVNLTINPLPNKPTVTYTGNLEFCFDGVTNVVLHAIVKSPPAITSYQWYKNGAAMDEATTANLTLSQGTETGIYTVAALGANQTNCLGPVSDPVSVIIHALSNLTNPIPVVVCQNGTAVFTASTTDPVQTWQWEESTNGGMTYLTTGIGTPYSGFTSNTLNITPAALGMNGYYYRVEVNTPPDQGGCAFKSAGARLTVNPNATITLASAAGTNIQSPCINTPITNITYSVGGGGTGAGVAGLPAELTGSYTGGVFTISGSPTVAGVYGYTVTTTGTCTQAAATGTITVRPNNTIALTSAAGTDNQTRCISTAITNITYSTSGATGATFAGLPAGVTGSWDANIVTISGTPTASGTFSYTVALTGGCSIITQNGTIAVTPNNTITLTSAAGTASQTRCISTAITNITYSATGATGATFAGLPSGVTGVWAGNVITISGTPAVAGSFNYTITLTGGCGVITQPGSITVTSNNTITLTSAADTDNQTVCISTLLTNITYSTPGATGATFASLPQGVSGAWEGNAITISGMPTTSGTFNYVITLTGGCGVITGNGTIIVSPNNTIALTSDAGTDSQSICLNTPITNIRYTTTGATGATYADLPEGVNGAWDANVINISGTPVVAGTFSYTSTLTGGCGLITHTGTITVNPAAIVNAGPDQSICAVASVTLEGSVGGSAASATWSGGTGTYVPDNLVLNPVYTPSAAERTAKTVTLTLTTNDPAGLCPAVSDQLTVSIGTTLTAATLTGSGDICSGTASSIRSIITGGASPYTINYTRNGVAQAAITPYISGAEFNLGILPVGTYNYLITSVTDPCGNSVTPAGLPAVYIIQVYPLPDITGTVPETQTICSDGTASLTLNSTVNNTTFNYTVAAVPATGYTWAAGKDPIVGSLFDDDGNGTEILNRQLQHNSSSAVTVIYTITPTGPESTAVPGTPVTRTVIVNPVAAVANMTTTTCSSSAFSVTPFNVTNGVVPAGTTYSWAAPDVTDGLTGGSAGADAASITGTLNNPTSIAQTATYTVTPVITGCNGATFTLTVTVSPTPAVANMTGTSCSASSFTVTPADITNGIVPAGTTYSCGLPVVTGGITGGAIVINATILTGTLTNPTNIPQTATYTLLPESGDCVGATFTVTITVNPKPSIANKTATACSATTFTVTPVNVGAEIVPGGTTYTWTAPVIAPLGSITGGSAQAVCQANISQTLTNTTNVAATATYTITPASGACAGANFTVTVTVNPETTISDKAATICSATAFSVTPVNGGAEIVPSGTTYTWTNPFIEPVGSITGGSAQAVGQANISQTLTNTTTAPETATYTVTPLSGACAGSTFTVTVTVNPMGQTDQPGNQTLCNNTGTNAIVFNTLNSVGATTYTWTNSAPSIGIPATGSGNISAFTAVNTGIAPVTATIIVTPTFTNNAVVCTGSTKTFTITVNPTPVLSSTLTPADVCSNTPFSYVPLSAAAGTTFNWSRASVPGITPAGPTSGTNNPNETLRNIASWPVSVTWRYTLAANGCSNVQDVVVNIKPEPVITAAQNIVASSGNALNYSILMDNFANPANNVTFSWPAPVLNPVNQGFSGGTARGPASSANITDIFSNTTGAPGIATYIVTPFYNGCAGTAVNVVVTVGPEPVLDPGLNSFVCNNADIGLVLREASGSVVPTYYNIISKTVEAGLTDAGNAVIPNTTAPASYLSTDKYTNTTGVNKTVTYRVQPIMAPNCIGAAVDVVITIRPQPVILPGQTKVVCSGVAIAKEIVLVSANTPAGTLFSWPVPVISDASSQGTAGINVSADPPGTIHINDAINNYSAGPITATYTISPVSASGCAGPSVTALFTIYPEPDPLPVSGRDKICVNEKNIVYNVPAVSGSSFHWTIDAPIGTKTFDFNTNAILVDAAAVGGSGNVTVYATNSYTCRGDVSTLPVQVFAVQASENITGPVAVCTNSTHVYSVTNRAGSTYNWSVPGGTAIVGDPSASSITLVFANAGGTISVRETNAAGCITNHNPLTVNIYSLPTATFSGGATICDGGSGNLSVDFTGTGPYSFTYALNGVPQPPVNTVLDPYQLNVTLAGTYTIVNVSDAQCSNIGAGTTTVSYFPKPPGIISGTTEICSGGVITFTGLLGSSRYFWDFGDGTSGYSQNSVSHIYTNLTLVPVTRTVTMTTTSFNNCVDVQTLDIVVLPVPLPQFSANPPAQVFNAAGNPVVFTNETNPDTWNWLWTFGDGDSATIQDPTHNYTDVGVYDVTLIVSNAYCTANVKHQVRVTEVPPVADFDSLPSGCKPLSLVIDNTSLNTDLPTTTYMWDFGDGSVSTAKNPTYTYFEAGTYSVMLTVTGPGGTSVKSQLITSYPSPKAYFEVSSTKVFANDEKLRYNNFTEGAVYYLWDFGDGDTSRVAEPYHRYMTEGTYEITLWAYSSSGCSDKYLLSPGVTVEPSGEIRFPTVFTPNKDAEIDMDHLPASGVALDQFFFAPVREKVIKYKLQIFNRVGVLIFETNDINKPWNGYYKSSLCPQGVYLWHLEGKYENGVPFRKAGDITLLH